MSSQLRMCILLTAAVSMLALTFGSLAPLVESQSSPNLLISEFRLRGIAGPNDEFIEIYNNSNAPHAVSAADGSAGYAIAASDGVARCIVPNGTVIPARGHFLCVNSVGYSLAAYPGGGGDATYTADIPDNTGVAIFMTANPASFTLTNRVDAVGPTIEDNTLYREGAGYPGLTPFSINYSFYRDTCGKSGAISAPGPCTISTPKDTNDNAADLIFVDTNGTRAFPELGGQRHGAPGPENLSSPSRGVLPEEASVSVSLFDPAQAVDSSPNYVKDLTPRPNATFGTVSVRRVLTNTSGQPITRLRFRVVDMTTFPAPPGFADLRFLNSASVLLTRTDGSSVTVRGTTVEEPPSQPNGGGFNCTLSVDTITANTPLPPGGSVSVHVLMGLEQTGVERFQFDIPFPTLETTTTVVAPDNAANVGAVPVTIYGNSFAADAQVRLRRAGQPDIVGSPVRVIENGRIILTSFNLLGAAVGAWDVVLTNPGGGARTLEGAFNVRGAAVSLVSPSSGGNRGMLSVNIFGIGFKEGAGVRLVKAGQADVHAAAAVVGDEGRLVTASFDFTGKVLGLWSVVVRNPDGADITRTDGFRIEEGRGGSLRVSVMARTAVRLGQRERLSVVYENDGNNDIDARLIVVSGSGAAFAFDDVREFRPTLRLLAVGTSGAAGRISPGAKHSIELLMGASGAASATVDVGVVENEGVPFEWSRLAAEGVPAGYSPQEWSQMVGRARSRIGESFGDVMAVVRGTATQSLQAPSNLVNFDEMLLYIVAVYGESPPSVPVLRSLRSQLASQRAAPAPSSVADEVKLLTVGTEVPNAERTVVLTHGWHGLYKDDGTRSRQDFFDLAEAIKANCGNVNVYMVDWSDGADTLFPGPAANNINPSGDEAFKKLLAKNIDPAKTTFYGESFGNYVNARIAKHYTDVTRAKVGKILAGNPANGIPYRPPDLTQFAEKSVALHTSSLADTSKNIADYDLFLDTKKEGHTEKHISSVRWLENCVKTDGCSWALLDKPFKASASDDFYDGSAENDCKYEEAPVPKDESKVPDEVTPPPTLRARIQITVVNSRDPNDKTGLHGAGAGRFFDGNILRLPYTIFFENVAGATAPAQVVNITDQLDADLLDLSTFNLGPITFGDRTVVPPPGLREFTTEVDLRPANNLVVRIEARLNLATGLMTWKFTSLDTLTLLPTDDPFAGFLPPNKKPPEGDGSVSFSVSPKGGLATGTALRNKARIVFDTNEPIDTPEWLNTVDRTAPQSKVLPLAAAQPGTSFEVSWAGTDEGAGVARYTILVSENGGPFAAWLSDTTATSGIFQGQPNRRYDFYSVARDEVGNTEPAPTAADTATRTIPSTFQFAGAQLAVAEDVAAVDLAVARAGDLSAAASVRYETEDGTASERSDYLIALGTLSFAPGETQKTVRVFITDDALHEGDETFKLRLGAPTSGVSGLGGLGNVTLTITDNDAASGQSPVGWGPNFDPSFFVRQHYRDFLGREPDPSGFDFWTREITDCGSNVGCQEVKRVHVSAAFFLSIEFQETGYLVYRTYKSAYGDISTARPAPVRLREFLLDTQEIGRGIVVRVGDWEAQLKNNKRNYFNSLVKGARFTSAFPATMTAAEFVDKLNINAGGVLSQAERDVLVGELSVAGNSPQARASILHKVAEDTDLVRSEFNRAFVLMQYFGYLRRDPDSTPDTDFTGYNFWLSKLNQFNGNFIEAEMVKAFITSDEYRKRFGQ